MDVKRLFLSAALAATVGATSSLAASPYGERMETIAPIVTAASCQAPCESGSACCDSAGGGLLSGWRRGSSAVGCDSGCGLLDGGCDGGCDSACGGCDSACGGCDDLGLGCEKSLLGYGFIKQSDHCFDDFISPMTNPVFFEDPRTLTEARFIFLNHDLPAALGGNSVQVYAMQARAALTKRLSLIATKDGFIYTQSPVLDSGFADIAAGLKYNLYRDAACGRLLSVGATFEMPPDRIVRCKAMGMVNSISSHRLVRASAAARTG